MPSGTATSSTSPAGRRLTSALSFASLAGFLVTGLDNSVQARQPGRDCIEQPAPVADGGGPRRLEVVGREPGQDLAVELVVAERLLVPLQAEPAQPSRDVHLRFPRPGIASREASYPDSGGAGQHASPARRMAMDASAPVEHRAAPWRRRQGTPRRPRIGCRGSS